MLKPVYILTLLSNFLAGKNAKIYLLEVPDALGLPLPYSPKAFEISVIGRWVLLESSSSKPENKVFGTLTFCVYTVAFFFLFKR
jgi:hypothetical protein